MSTHTVGPGYVSSSGASTELNFPAPVGAIVIRRFSARANRSFRVSSRLSIAGEDCVKHGITPRPDILVYIRKDDVSFEERLRGKTDEHKAADV